MGEDSVYLVETSDDASMDVLKVALNVSKTYSYDPDDDSTLYTGDVMLLTNDNFSNWAAGDDFAGVTVKNNAIEHIYDSEENELTLAKISQLAHDVALWLNSANGGAGYANVLTALASNDADLGTLTGYFSRESNWIPKA